MRNLVYNVTHSVLPINSSPLTITLFFSVITTLVYNDTKYSVPFMTLQEFDCAIKRSLPYPEYDNIHTSSL
jgi:hypothetical protein